MIGGITRRLKIYLRLRLHPHQLITKGLPSFPFRLNLSGIDEAGILKTTFTIQGHFKEFATTHANGVDKLAFTFLFNDKAMQVTGSIWYIMFPLSVISINLKPALGSPTLTKMSPFELTAISPCIFPNLSRLSGSFNQLG